MIETRILNLGAGVQSTALALMSHRRCVPDHVPVFDCAVFADTQEEPDEVYRHLEWLTKEVSPSFPVHVRSAGKLGDDLMFGTTPSGASYETKTGQRFASIPAFTSAIEGEPGGLTRRQCTNEYKTSVIRKFIRTEVMDLAPRQRIPQGHLIHQYIGLSYDEPKRIFGRNGKPGVKARIEADKWARPYFPLYEMFLTRHMLEAWLQRYGIPHKVPRSACLFCPFHSNAEWARIKENDPDGWERCLTIDNSLRGEAFFTKGLTQGLYLHRSCRPLADIDFTIPDPVPRQQDLNFSNLECEGMCGL